MYPWMNQSGFGNYNPGTGQWSQPPQPQMDPQMQEMQQRGNIQDRMGNLNSRITKLQEQYKGAGTEQQAGIQSRIDAMQGNVGRLQGKLDAGGGANRIGMDFRKERRQAKNAGTYDPTAQQGGGQQMNGMAQYFGQLPPGFGQGPQGSYGVGGMGMGGGMPQYGGMNYGGGMQSWMQQPMMYGGYNSGANQTGLAEQGQMPTGAQRPGMQYRQDRRQARQGGNEMAQAGQQQGGAPSWYEAGSFDTPFGNLVQSSVGNGNIYKQNGSDGQSLYHYDPAQGWKHMTQQEYMGYNNPADFYQDPNQYAAAAGGNKSQMQMRNGMYQNMLGTGTYR